MKNFTVNSALAQVKGSVDVQGKLIKVTGQVGLKCLSALDYLNTHGYNVIYPTK